MSADRAGGDDLAALGREALRRRHPSVLARLDAIGTPAARPVIEAGRLVNLDLGTAHLYPEAAPAWTARQIETYCRNPDRLRAADPAGPTLSTSGRRVLPSLESFLAGRPEGKLTEAPVADVGFAFIFGIGLGYHLPELLARLRPRHMILVEPVAELLLHSLSAIDWRSFLDQAAAQGTAVHLLVGDEPEQLILDLEAVVVHSRDAGFLDGSYAYVHYPSWQLRRARELLNERIGNLLVNRSFFEDEAVMMDNTCRNLGGSAFHLVDGRPRLDQAMPLFVVGSGPSLDDSLPHLARWRSRAVVLSCGSALGVLLKNGLRPDIHLENENSLPLVANLAGFRDIDPAGLGGVILLASTTVNPGVGAFFGRRWLYFRAPLSSAAVLAGGAAPIAFAGPLVANAAVAVGAAAGFRRIYLFGIDCGRREGRGHHARDAVYYEPGYDNFVAGESHELLETEFDRRVPANFGGEAWTSARHDLSRRTLAELLRQRPELACVNLSDGARIDGARPLVPAALRLDGPEDGQAETLARIEAQLVAFAPGAFLDRIDLAGQIAAAGRLRRRLAGELAAARLEDDGFFTLWRRLERLRRETGTAADGVWTLIGGSLANMIRLGAYRGTRLADPALRCAFLDAFLAAFEAESAALIERAEALLRQMTDGGSVP